MTARTRFIHRAAALVVAGSAGLAFAAPSALLKALDPDNDGTVSLAEARTAAEARFAALDPDQDGTLDAKELEAVKITRAELGTVDPDRDGKLDKAEYLALVELRFKAADPDNDGTVSDAEFGTKAGKALASLLVK
ncbi:EF-hand domain-containing protein [Derxia gummosa]|uniref:EF-hand domain-containing protein n=1 Tax=Derxia gummosa DSM 723 TaxID=1121388 RepID=A0A8B6X1C4_9BURK|nr:EF-hand domain-containing protein [Derxia gummosa]